MTDESKPELTADERACWAHAFFVALAGAESAHETEATRAARIADEALETLRRRGMVSSANAVIYEPR